MTVTAYEKEANEKRSITVNTNKNGLKPSQIRDLVEEAQEQESLDELDRVRKLSYYEIEDLCSNILMNINNKEFKLTKKDTEVITDDITNIMEFLKEKKHDEREIEEYEEVITRIKQKYGVLILHGKIDETKVKGKTDEINASTVYGNDNDQEEQDLKGDIFANIRNEELGVQGMTDNEVSELKELRNSLYELCKNVLEIIHSGRMNLSREHKKEFLEYMDDIMLWYHSHEKPTKIEYKEKIDYVNSICDEIIEKFEKENRSIVVKTDIVNDNDKSSNKLEKLCLTIMTMVSNGHIPGSQARLILLNKKMETALKFVYEYIEEAVETIIDPIIDPFINSGLITDRGLLDNGFINSGLINNIVTNAEKFEQKCEEYIKEINELCDHIYNNMQGIFVDESKRVVTMAKTRKVVDEDYIKSNFNMNDDGNGDGGTSILEILRNKQNEEIDQMIDDQIINEQQ